MNMLWFVPIAALVGLAGSHTTIRARHALRANKKERAWWLLLVLAWAPLAFWILSQFVTQD